MFLLLYADVILFLSLFFAIIKEQLLLSILVTINNLSIW